MTHTRRNFFKLAAGAAALTAVPMPAAAAPVAEAASLATPTATGTMWCSVRVVSASGKERVIDLGPTEVRV
ncbi:MAG TPA: hypothetical protein DG761_08305 [Gammaproteobacteria bacterium]|nr:hypothetical protein [Gammaproteobacteria bacterium]